MAGNGKGVTYEYVADVLSIVVEPKVNDGLKKRAAEGWELFSVTPCWWGNPTEYDAREIQNMFVFRRPAT
jgi:hypothetical protein